MKGQNVDVDHKSKKKKETQKKHATLIPFQFDVERKKESTKITSFVTSCVKVESDSLPENKFWLQSPLFMLCYFSFDLGLTAKLHLQLSSELSVGYERQFNQTIWRNDQHAVCLNNKFFFFLFLFP